MNLLISDLGKRYRRDFWGLRHFNLNVGSGVLGLLGPNGAGKSTLMKILATVTLPSEGNVVWNGCDAARSPEKMRPDLGYLPQDFGIYPNLNADEFLTYLAAARGITGKTARNRIHQLLELVNMIGSRRMRLGSLSGGMKQRIGIAQALLGDPKLLIVDEPTAGLDPEERIRFRNLLSELSGERVVILSSHIVSDLEAAATSIAIMNRGRLITHGTPEELLRSVDGRVWEVTVSSADLAELRKTHLVSSTVRTVAGVKARVISERGVSDAAVAVRPTIEDAYLMLLSQDRGSRDVPDGE